MACQHNNPPGYAFCGTCGEGLQPQRCRCGFINPSSHAFCGNCGFELAQLDADLSSSAADDVPVGKYNLAELVALASGATVSARSETKKVSQDDIAGIIASMKKEGEA